jgi:ribosomal protein S6--L-glutamate ligase
MTLHLCFMVAGRQDVQVISPVLADVFERLRGRGFRIDVLAAEYTVLRPDLLAATHDLYLLKSDTELALSLTGILHAHGARILNPYWNCLAAKDKIAASRRLHAGGILAPRCWATMDPELLRPVVEEVPLVIKPCRGFHGNGVRKVTTPDELSAVPRTYALIFAQEFIEGTGEDLKIYVVGDRVFATRKPFSACSYLVADRQCPVSAEVRDVALRCGEVFGLGLYGLDVVEGLGGPHVVDINYFPGYKGLPEAPRTLADYIGDYAHGRRWLPLAGPIVPVETAAEPVSVDLPGDEPRGGREVGAPIGSGGFAAPITVPLAASPHTPVGPHADARHRPQ